MMFPFTKHIVKVLACLFIHVITVVDSIPEEGIIAHAIQKTYQQCVEECDKSRSCVLAKFIRRFELCKLYSKFDNKTNDPGVKHYSKHYSVVCEDSNCSTHINDTSCGQPNNIPDTAIFGNMVFVGAKVKYQCLRGPLFAVSECLPNGSWSNAFLPCNCSNQFMTVTSTLKNIQRWTFVIKDEKHYLGKPTCSDTCSISTEGHATCVIETGNWYYDSAICCNHNSKLVLIFYILFENTSIWRKQK